MAKKEKVEKEQGAQSPVSLEYFRRHARPLVLDVDVGAGLPRRQISCSVKAPFGTGSFGWHGNDKIDIVVGDEILRVQPNLLFIVINSRPKDPKAKGAETKEE